MIKFLRRYIRYAFILLLLGIKITEGYAQYDNVWAFGGNAGVDFNTNPPTPIVTSIYSNEACASVCNSNGQLLFYTDGGKVWNRNNKVMPNGSDLPGVGTAISWSATQGTIIVPVPGDTGKYYIFSIGGYEPPSLIPAEYWGKLYYSIVDMALDSGLGSVISKGKLLDTGLAEHMTAVSGNECNIWLLVLAHKDPVFKAYNIDANGISAAPVVSSRMGVNPGIGIGSIDVSPDRNRIAYTWTDNLYLYDFDLNSGKITNPLIVDRGASNRQQPPSYYYYGVCFSPDNTKLYASGPEYMAQFDLSLGDDMAIRASKTKFNLQAYVAIKRAPDGKVYTASVGSATNNPPKTLNVINHPNLAGAACQYVADGFTLAAGTFSISGLPNLNTIILREKINSTAIDSTLCSAPRTLEAADLSGRNYVWEDGTLGATRIVNTRGVYWVRYSVPVNTPCQYEEHADTFNVVFRFTTRNIYTTIMDTGMCKDDTVLMQAGNPYGIDYMWDDGSEGQQRITNKAGIYWLSYRVDSLCEHYTDSFIITYPEYKVSFSADTLICIDKPVTFQNTSDRHFNNFLWSFGDRHFSDDESPIHNYMQPGVYQAMLTGTIGSICPDTFRQTIIADTIFPVHFTTDKNSICTGQSISFKTSRDNTATGLLWQFGDGDALSGLDATNIEHAFDRDGMLIVTLSQQFRACPESAFTDTVYVYPLPRVHLGADTGLCLNGAPLILKNLQEPPREMYHILWSTGDTTETLKIAHPGTYSLTLRTEPLGCSATESVLITKDCYIDIPNAFTPNGDGVNDYFYPRQLLSEGIVLFKMEIFNRWGQRVFITENNEGRGWDGKFNGREQPIGVYVYTIEVSYDNGKVESYKGNVSLLR